eukprot:scaffold84951_cov72-Phaeocystis_antarctica.AAC.2
MPHQCPSKRCSKVEAGTSGGVIETTVQHRKAASARTVARQHRHVERHSARATPFLLAKAVAFALRVCTRGPPSPRVRAYVDPRARSQK